MADPELVDLLVSDVDQWNQMRTASGEKADLRGANLRGADLRSADLRVTDLRVTDLRDADLRDANLRDADLVRADLRGADLVRADLRGANLRDAHLSRANLFSADLRSANLRSANLIRADLPSANLRNADLRDADLSGAVLSSADLHSADLTHANFAGASCGGTSFGHVDLSTVVGLGSANHVGPSSIGIDTFMISEGDIDDDFLLGCGVPDLFVKYGRDIAAPFNVAYYSAFLSHSSVDKPLVRRFYDALHKHRRIPCWLDEHQMIPGDDLRDSITDGIRRTDKMILFCSKESLGSWWVDDEVRKMLATEKAFHDKGQPGLKLLIPVAVDDAIFEEGVCTHSWADTVRDRIIQTAQDWDDEGQRQTAIDAVANALRTKPMKGLLPEPKLDPNR